MATANRFSKGLETQKKKEAIIESQAPEEAEEDKAKNQELLDSLFTGGKPRTSKAHSIYITDTSWKKLQKLSKKEGISVSAVIQKIFDSVL